jgi:hypothetical protein
MQPHPPFILCGNLVRPLAGHMLIQVRGNLLKLLDHILCVFFEELEYSVDAVPEQVVQLVSLP